MKKSNSLSKKGFTLIELLVVISIISLMSSIVMAAVNSARAKAQVGAGQQFNSNLDHEIGANAIAWYDFTEISAASTTDKSGNNYKLLPFMSSLSWQSDSPFSSGQSLLISSTANSARTSAVVTVTAPVTVAAWVKLSSVGTAGFACVGSAATPNAYGIGIPTGSNFGSFNGFYNNNVVSGKTQAQAGVWTHVAGVLNNGVSTIYVNGQLAGSGASNPTLSGNTNAIFVGADCSSAQNMNGEITGVRIYGSALTADAIEKTYLAEKTRFIADRETRF